MLKFPVIKLFTTNFTMEMISLPMLLTKKLLDQRKKNVSSFQCTQKNICKFKIFFVLGTCVCIKKIHVFGICCFCKQCFHKEWCMKSYLTLCLLQFCGFIFFNPGVPLSWNCPDGKTCPFMSFVLHFLPVQL